MDTTTNTDGMNPTEAEVRAFCLDRAITVKALSATRYSRGNPFYKEYVTGYIDEYTSQIERFKLGEATPEDYDDVRNFMKTHAYPAVINPNHALMSPLLDAVEAFERERSLLLKKQQTANPADIARLERPMNAAAVAAVLLLIDALNEGAAISFPSEVQS